MEKQLESRLTKIDRIITNDLIDKEYAEVADFCNYILRNGTLPEIKTALICTKAHKDEELIKPEREKLLAKYEELRGSKAV